MLRNLVSLSSSLTFIIILFDTSQGQNSYCPEKNGRFATSQCDAYIECVNGIPEQKLCPDGLLFNPKAMFYGDPCSYPIDVNCEGRSETQPAQPTEMCPHQFGYYRMGDTTHCGQFVNCASGRGYVFDCPEGLAFNEETYKCDWPDQVRACDAEAYLGFTCPQSENNEVSNQGFTFYRHPEDCQKYFLCVNGRPRLQNCGEEKAFNELIGICDDIANVTTCSSQHQQQQQQQLQRSSGTFKVKKLIS